MQRLRLGAGAAAISAAALVILVSTAPAFAHTEKDAGPYKIEFGWQHEPTYAGIENAVQVFVKDAKGNAVDDLGAKGLTVQVSTGGQTSGALALETAFDPDTGEGTHGEFDAAIMPTAVGTYTFHITGDIKGTAVDVSAASSDSTFNDVKNPSDIQFPVKTPTTQDISAAVTNLQNRLATAQSEAAAAKSSAKSAKSTAVIAIIVAVVLGLIAIVVGARGRKKVPAA